MSLLRLFLPSWRFFDDATTGIVLKVRVARVGAPAGPWVEVLTPPTRRVHHVLWNPAGNQALAAYSLVERLLLDASEGGRSFEVSHALVGALARTEITRLGLGAGAATYEYLVSDRLPSGDEELLVSGPLPW